MKHYLLILAIMASSSVSVSYGGFLFKGKDKQKKVNKEVYKEAPRWYDKVKEPKGWKYQKGMGTSKFDAQVAIDKAYLSAKGKISALIKSEVSQNMTDVLQELGGIEDDAELYADFTRVTESMSSGVIENLVEVESEVIRHKGDSHYTAYYLIGYDIKEAEKKMLEAIKKEERVYESMKTTELLKQLESKKEDYQEKYND